MGQSADDLAGMADLGIMWTRSTGAQGMVWDRIDPDLDGTYDWTKTDRIASKLTGAGIKVIWTTKSFNKKDQGVARMNQKDLKAPNDMQAYVNFISAAAERYDGDGIDDAPGSPLVDYWSIENEMNGNFWYDTAEAYAEVLVNSYQAINAANPNAKVAIGGVGSPQGIYEGAPSYTEIFDALDKHNGTYFDIMDVHWYGFVGEYNELSSGRNKRYKLGQFMDELEVILLNHGYDVPIWITETGVYSGANVVRKDRPAVEQTEVEQATELLKRYMHFSANGVKKVFWFGVVEKSSQNPNEYFTSMGLVYNGAGDDDRGEGVKKFAYYTYKKTVEVLDGSDWNGIETIRDSDGIYIYKFNNQGKPTWVAWNDNSGEIQVTISGISSSQVRITKAVPEYGSGYQVTDYSTAFNTQTSAVSSGQITLTLGENPVFVEQI